MQDSNNEVFCNIPNKNLPAIKLFPGKKNFENQFALMVSFQGKIEEKLLMDCIALK